jgi:non-lysosomal glucosylceramidase
LIYEGLVEEGLDMLKVVRDRHEGVRRNAWDEVECEHNYPRSMSSWALLRAPVEFERKVELSEGDRLSVRLAGA